MNIQFALVNPSLVGGNNVTILAGIAQTDQVIADFTTIPFALHSNNPGEVVIAKHAVTDSLLNRNAWGENITTNSFHAILAMEVWKGVASNEPAGEVAFVKTDLPGTPEGQSTYVIFGLIKGDGAKLQSMADAVFETSTNPLQTIGPWDLIKTRNSGIKVTHTMGTHLLDCLHQPIWGFGGSERYGMGSDISMPTFYDLQENSIHIAKNGVGLPGMHMSKPEPNYIEFLQLMDKEGLMPSPQWQSADQIKIREDVSSRIVGEIYRREEENDRKRYSSKHSADDSPAP
jgi:hypothetical protein